MWIFFFFNYCSYMRTEVISTHMQLLIERSTPLGLFPARKKGCWKDTTENQNISQGAMECCTVQFAVGNPKPRGCCAGVERLPGPEQPSRWPDSQKRGIVHRVGEQLKFVSYELRS